MMGKDWLSSLKLTISNFHSLLVTSSCKVYYILLCAHAEVLGIFKGAEVWIHVVMM